MRSAVVKPQPSGLSTEVLLSIDTHNCTDLHENKSHIGTRECRSRIPGCSSRTRVVQFGLPLDTALHAGDRNLCGLLLYHLLGWSGDACGAHRIRLRRSLRDGGGLAVGSVVNLMPVGALSVVGEAVGR